MRGVRRDNCQELFSTKKNLPKFYGEVALPALGVNPNVTLGVTLNF